MLKRMFFLGFLFSFTLFGQNLDFTNNDYKETFKVDSIKILGNKNTKDFIILRELNFSIGDIINNETLLFNRERIFSLGIFTKVSVLLEKRGEKNIAVIMIEESWYIFPIPFINVREKSFERTSYGISLKYKNFRGRNETIRATASFGYDPFYRFEYENPLLISSAEISLYLSFAFGSPINKSPLLEKLYGKPFDFKTVLLSAILGKRVTKESSFFFIFNYSNIKSPSNYFNDYMASGSSSDKQITAGLSYSYDSRNLKQYASKGEYLELNYLLNGIGNKNISYNTINIDTRKYQEIYKSLLVKGHLNLRHTFGKRIPLYDNSMLGYDYYIRGNRYNISEGNNRILASLELAYPILPEWNFAIDLPILPNSLTRSRIAIIAGIFSDAGTVFNNVDKFELNNFSSGYGFGLTFLFLPYSAFRIEYAFNEFGKGELLLGTGISF